MKKLIVSLSLIIANGQQYLQGVEVFKAPETSSKISNDYVEVLRPSTPNIAEKANVAIKAQAPELKAAKTTDDIAKKEQNNSYKPNTSNELEFYKKPTQNFLALNVEAEQDIIKNIQKNGSQRVKPIGALNFRMEDNPAKLKEALKGRSLNEISTNLTNLLNTTEDINIIFQIKDIARSNSDNISTNHPDAYNPFSNLAIMARDKISILYTLSNEKLSLSEKQQNFENALKKLENSENGGSDYYTMSLQDRGQIISWYKNALDQIERQQNLQSLPLGEEAEIAYKPNDTMLIRNRSEKNTAENQTLARSSTQDAIELLQQNITNLKTQAQRALDIYNTSKNSSDAMNSLGSYIKTSATIFWKQGAISRMKMQQFFIDMFTTTKTDIPETEINNMTDAAMERMPKQTDSVQKQTSWINSLSNMLSDTIARFTNSSSPKSQHAPNTELIL